MRAVIKREEHLGAERGQIGQGGRVDPGRQVGGQVRASRRAVRNPHLVTMSGVVVREEQLASGDDAAVQGAPGDGVDEVGPGCRAVRRPDVITPAIGVGSIQQLGAEDEEVAVIETGGADKRIAADRAVRNEQAVIARAAIVSE